MSGAVELFVLVSIVVVMGVVIFCIFSSENKRKISTAVSEKIDAEYVFVSSWDNSIIGLNFKKRKIALGKDFIKVLDFKQIVQVDLIRDSNVISSTDRMSQLSGAVVGGVLFGGVGALAGALSGATHSVSALKKLGMRIIADDGTYYLTFIDMGASTSSLSDFYVKHLTEQADYYYGLVLNAMRLVASDVRAPVHAPVAPVATPQASGRADEIEKLWALKEKGILSDQEYKLEKMRLLSKP